MIDLRNKCGSCSHFKPIDGTCNGECLLNPYGADVVHDPKHPHWIVARSRMKCKDYNRPPMTNADHIRAMSDEELALFLSEWGERSLAWHSEYGETLGYLQEPAKEEA